MSRPPAFLSVAILLLALASLLPACRGSAGQLRLATTTSLYDTGLWEYLEPLFEDEYGIELHVLSAGTGKALELGKRGDVDAVVVHSRAREEQFVTKGYGVERVPFAYNHFLIIGPESDPANISGAGPEAAFAALMAKGETDEDIRFVSRGDDSGTHGKEKAIWASAGYDYEVVRASRSWYVESGSGMGTTLMMADEKQAYTLTDIGTYTTFESDLGLVPIVDEGDALLNVYSILVSTRATNPAAASSMVEFLTSEQTQALIGTYGVEEHGRQLFTPYAREDM
ncbi:MAG: substrate-binding domain-containing protein [Dehalococcoidia bacterium]